MILKQKTIDQKSDDELAHDLKKVVARDGWLARNTKNINAGVGIALGVGGFWVWGPAFNAGMASGHIALGLLGFMSGPLIWGVGLVVCAIGVTNIYNKVANVFHRQAKVIRTEQEDRAFKKTPAYQEFLIEAKEKLRKAFNNAVDKVFHGGTENKVAVKKPLQFKKPGEPQKKKTIFHFGK
jgi:hypothetical protein